MPAAGDAVAADRGLDPAGHAVTAPHRCTRRESLDRWIDPARRGATWRRVSRRVRSVGEDERRRSPELELVRQMLFPKLPPEEGWRRLEAALEGARDDERSKRIEELAGQDLSGDLLAIVRRLQAQSDEASE